jgi:hypothetical protein
MAQREDDPMSTDKLSRAEIGKDTVQAAAEAAASTVGEVASILTAAVKDIATVVGDFATEVFEIRDSARKASAEHDEGSRDGS